jgi:hypothetical protein
MALNGFFSNKFSTKPTEEYSVINVGAKQFNAAATALIDYLHNPQHGNDAFLKKILDCFYESFPKYANHQSDLNASERMKILIDNHRKSELVECMADVLHYLTVVELFKKPLKYREVWAQFNAKTPKSHLYDPQTKLPTSALKALAHALEINIILSYKEDGKVLRKCKKYIGGVSATQANAHLMIQVQGDQYFPMVQHKKDFVYVGRLAISPLKPENRHEEEGTLADIFSSIDQDNTQLLQAYEQWRKTILSMYQANKEITYTQLRDLFITHYPVEEADSLSLPDLASSKRKPVIANTLTDEEYLVELFANYLAGWIVTKKAPDNLFDGIEKQKPVEKQTATKMSFR